MKSALLFLAAAVVLELATIPFFGIASLRAQNPSETALMRQRIREAELQQRAFTIVQKWIPLSRIPRQVIDAVVVAEDGTFFTHGGVDWFEVQASLEKDIQQRRATRGGSTITQQVAKNLFLSTSKDPVRKVKELLITLLLERELGKERILEIYLNIIEWGRGLFGVEAASERYFGKSVEDLTLDEAARLAAVIPSPLTHRPDAESKYVLRRKGIVLERMAARNMIPSGESPTVLPAADSTETEENPPELPEADSTETSEGRVNGLQGRQPSDRAGRGL